MGLESYGSSVPEDTRQGPHADPQGTQLQCRGLLVSQEAIHPDLWVHQRAGNVYMFTCCALQNTEILTHGFTLDPGASDSFELLPGTYQPVRTRQSEPSSSKYQFPAIGLQKGYELFKPISCQ